MDLTDFQIKGFTYTFDYDIIDLIGELPPIDEWEIDDEYDVQYPENVDLAPAMDYISAKYMSEYFPNHTAGYKYLWCRTESSTMLWHNDLIEGCKVFFLYYLTDVTEGGEICFRVNKTETGFLQPRKHMLVMASQESHVEHKVNYTPEMRIVSNYGFDY
jgi:hypothetical protein